MPSKGSRNRDDLKCGLQLRRVVIIYGFMVGFSIRWISFGKVIVGFVFLIVFGETNK